MFLPTMRALLSRKKPAISSVLETPHLHLGGVGRRGGRKNRQEKRWLNQGKSWQRYGTAWCVSASTCSTHVVAWCSHQETWAQGGWQRAGRELRTFPPSRGSVLRLPPAPPYSLGLSHPFLLTVSNTWTKVLLLLTRNVAIARLVLVGFNCSGEPVAYMCVSRELKALSEPVPILRVIWCTVSSPVFGGQPLRSSWAAVPC